MISLKLNATLIFFKNKRSLFGLTGKGPWGRITHSEYVIRRYELHLKIGVEDRIFRKRKGFLSIVSALSCNGIETP